MKKKLAVKWLKKVADIEPGACYELYLINLPDHVKFDNRGLIQDKNFLRALKWLQLAAKKKYGPALYEYAWLRHNQCGERAQKVLNISQSSVSEMSTVQLFEEAAKKQYREAQLEMALIYEKGKYGQVVDHSKANYWYHQVLQNASIELQERIAQRLEKLQKVEPTIEKSNPERVTAPSVEPEKIIEAPQIIIVSPTEAINEKAQPEQENTELLQNEQETAERFDSKNNTAAHGAVIYEKQDTLLRLLKKKPKLLTITNNQGETPFVLSVRLNKLKIAQLLLKKSKITPAEVMAARCTEGNTLLHLAAQSGNESLMKLLLKNKDYQALIKAPNDHGEFAIHTAVKVGQLTAFKILSSHIPMTAVDGENNTVAHTAARYAQKKILDYIPKKDHSLLTKRNSKGQSPAHIAALYNHSTILEWLENKKIKFNQSLDSRLQNPLQVAVSNFDCQAAVEFLIKSKEAQSLLSHRDSTGKTALHLLSETGNADLLKCILKKWKKTLFLDALDRSGRTALCYALEAEQHENLGLLLASGSDPLTLVGNEKKSVYHLANELASQRDSKLLQTCKIVLDNHKQADAIEKAGNKLHKKLEIAKKDMFGTGKIIDNIKKIFKDILNSHQDFQEYILSIEYAEKYNVVINRIVSSTLKAISNLSEEEKKFLREEMQRYPRVPDTKGKITKAVSVTIAELHRNIETIQPRHEAERDTDNTQAFKNRLKSIFYETVGAMKKIANGEYIDQRNQRDVTKVEAMLEASGAAARMAENVSESSGVAPVVQAFATIGIPTVVELLKSFKQAERQRTAERILEALTTKQSGNINIDLKAVDRAIETLSSRFNEFLNRPGTTLDDVAALANCVGERSLIHMTREGNDTRQGRESRAKKAVNKIQESVLTVVSRGYTPQQSSILTLEERCLFAIIEERDADQSDKVKIKINDESFYVKDVILYSGLKVWDSNNQKFDYYILESNKPRHELFGFCEATQEEVGLRSFKLLSFYEPKSTDNNAPVSTVTNCGATFFTPSTRRRSSANASPDMESSYSQPSKRQ